MSKNRNNKFLAYKLYFLFLISMFSSTAVLSGKLPDLDITRQILMVFVVGTGFLITWYYLIEFVYGAKKYLRTIKKSSESKAFKYLYNGAKTLIFSLLLVAFVNVFRLTPDMEVSYRFTTLVIYYGGAILAIIYSYYFGRAGIELSLLVGKAENYILFSVLAFGTVFSGGMIAWNNIKNLSSSTLATNHILNFVNQDIVFYSLIIPLLLAWAFILSGAYGIFLYQKYVKGLIYKKSTLWLSFGTVMLLVVSVSRHISDIIIGNTNQIELATDMNRVIILFTMVILATYSMNKGMQKLLSIER